jgi:hypothetical protein
MNEGFYADTRDLVKWGSLLHLARQHRLKTILQVAFRTGADKRPMIQCGSGSFPILAEVWTHFRNLSDIRRLGQRCGIAIQVYDVPFSPAAREPYLDDVVRRIQAIRGRKLVFLDPDTGLAAKARGSKHVTIEEAKQVWAALSPGDWLMLYQHRWRKTDWKDQARSRFRCVVSTADILAYQSEGVGGDVVFLAAQRQTRRANHSGGPSD